LTLCASWTRLPAVVLADLVCFVITVVSIAHVRRLQSSVGDRSAGPHLAVGWRDVVVYAKLATVTCGAWAYKAIIQFKLRNGIQNYTFGCNNNNLIIIII
jgi:hypothetical protein